MGVWLKGDWEEDVVGRVEEESEGVEGVEEEEEVG